MKGLEELITILHTRTYWHAPKPRDTHFNVLWSRSNITENYLIHHHFICRVPRDDSSAALLHCFLWLDNDHVTWWLIAVELFLEDIALAHLFLCSAAPKQNYFSQFTFYTSETCSDTIIAWQYISQHDTRTSNDNSSHSHLLWWHTCKPPHSTWNHDNTSHIGHASSISFSHRLWSQICRPPPNLTFSLRSSERTLGHASSPI